MVTASSLTNQQNNQKQMEFPEQKLQLQNNSKHQQHQTALEQACSWEKSMESSVLWF